MIGNSFSIQIYGRMQKCESSIAENWLKTAQPHPLAASVAVRGAGDATNCQQNYGGEQPSLGPELPEKMPCLVQKTTSDTFFRFTFLSRKRVFI